MNNLSCPGKTARIAVLFLVFLSLANMALAQSNVDQSAQELFSTVVRIVVKWIFPILSLFCGLYGVARGIKKGEWDFAVMCIGAAIILAVLPTAIEGLFGVEFSSTVNEAIGE